METKNRKRTTQGSHAEDRTLPWWVRPIVLFHVFAITVWSLPPPAPGFATGSIVPSVNTNSVGDMVRTFVPFIHDKILLGAFHVKEDNGGFLGKAVRGYVVSTGTWQYWDMFAPNPSNLDVWVDAEVTFLDGSKRTVPYPRMAQLSIPRKYAMERFRKFLERAHSEDFQFLWVPFAQHIALEANTMPTNPPTRVVLVRHFRLIQPPGEVTPEPYTVVPYFTFEVDQDALKADAGVR